MTSAGRARRHRRLTSAIALAAASYVLVLAAAPALHHDVVCHLKSRTHCTACVSGVSAPGTVSALCEAPVQPFRSTAVDLRSTPGVRAESANQLSGRSPPSSPSLSQS